MQPLQTQTKLIGVPAAADVLGVSKRMVYLLVSTGRLRACRIGDRVLIPIGEIDRLIASHMTAFRLDNAKGESTPCD